MKKFMSCCVILSFLMSLTLVSSAQEKRTSADSTTPIPTIYVPDSVVQQPADADTQASVSDQVAPPVPLRPPVAQDPSAPLSPPVPKESSDSSDTSVIVNGLNAIGGSGCNDCASQLSTLPQPACGCGQPVWGGSIVGSCGQASPCGQILSCGPAIISVTGCPSCQTATFAQTDCQGCQSCSCQPSGCGQAIATVGWDAPNCGNCGQIGLVVFQDEVTNSASADDSAVVTPPVVEGPVLEGSPVYDTFNDGVVSEASVYENPTIYSGNPSVSTPLEGSVPTYSEGATMAPTAMPTVVSGSGCSSCGNSSVPTGVIYSAPVYNGYQTGYGNGYSVVPRTFGRVRGFVGGRIYRGN